MIVRNQPAPVFLQHGVVLLETLIAILVFSFGVLGIVGLQAAMIKNTSDAKFRAEASFVAQQRIGMIWGDPEHIANYVEADTDISAILPSGTRTTSQPAVGQVMVQVTWHQPGETEHIFSTIASIVGG